MPGTLRSRIIWSYIAVALLTLALIGSVLFLFVRRVNHNEVQKQKDALVQQAQALANIVEVVDERQSASDNTGVNRLSALLNSSSLVLRAVVLVADARGDVVLPKNPPRGAPSFIPSELRPGPQLKLVETRSLSGQLVAVVAAPLATNAQGYDSLYIVKPVSELGAAGVPTLYYYLLAAAAIALLASIALALYLTYSVTKPVRALTRAAERMAAGDLAQEVSEEGPREMAELSHSFNFMARRLRDSARQQRDFVANVSHELRTPLTSIEGFSDALEEGLGDEASRRRYAGIVSQESRRLKRLLDGLLQLSALDAGEMTIRVSSLALEPFLGELRDRFAPLAGAAGVSFSLELEEGLPGLETDRDRLEQILTNLLDNALKFTDAGGEVKLVARMVEPGKLELSVADTGAGITPEDLPFIFDRFFRVERSRAQAYGGSGLGLAISRELAEALGGTLTAASRPGEGTVFTLLMGINS